MSDMETEVQKAVWPRWSGYLSESDQQCGSSDPEHIKGAGQTRRRGSAGPAGAIPASLLAVLTPAPWGGPPPRLHLAFLSSSFGSALFSGFSCWPPAGLWLSPTSSSQHTQHILEPCLIHPSAQNTLPTISPKQTLPASFYVFQQVPSPPRGEGAEGPFSNFPRTLCLSLQLAETLIPLQNGQLLLVGHWGKWGGVGGGTCSSFHPQAWPIAWIFSNCPGGDTSLPHRGRSGLVAQEWSAMWTQREPGLGDQRESSLGQ